MEKFDKLTDEFFDGSKPCPDIIPFCTQLRAKYQEEVAKLGSGCATCQVSRIRIKYITDLWQSYIKSLVNKA